MSNNYKDYTKTKREQIEIMITEKLSSLNEEELCDLFMKLYPKGDIMYNDNKDLWYHRI